MAAHPPAAIHLHAAERARQAQVVEVPEMADAEHFLGAFDSPVPSDMSVLKNDLGAGLGIIALGHHDRRQRI